MCGIALDSFGRAGTAQASRARGPAESKTSIHCEIDTRARAVRGTVTYEFRNVGSTALDRIYVWLLPNRFARQSPGITEVNYYWVYPERFNPGSMTITGARLSGQSVAVGASEPQAIAGKRTLWAVPLATAVSPGGVARLSLDYDALIPERYGTFGCVGEQCTLVGGFYPMLADLGAAGWDLTAPPMRGTFDVVVDTPRASSVIVFDQWSGDGVVRAHGHSDAAAYASVFVARRWHETRRVVGLAELRLLTQQAPPPADDARDAVLPYTKENYPRFALDTGAKAMKLVSAALGETRRKSVTVVEAPLRQDLATAQSGVVVISDRWYRIWPARRFRKFHDRELVRAVAAIRLTERLLERSRETTSDIDIAADMFGAYAADLFVRQEHHKVEFAGDILQPVSFVPVVDQLLYAPQTMFASAYFGTVLDDEVTRDRVDRFNHARPRGRLYFEKLRDLLTPAGLAITMRAMLVQGQSYRDAAELGYGSSLGWFFRQWSGPYPRVNYRLAGKRSVRRGDGRFDNQVTVAKEVAPGDMAPVEPVEVLVILRGGVRKHLRWDGAGSRETLRFVGVAPIERVEVDPRGRLVEADLDGGDEHPLLDNQDRHRTRFVYNSFGVLLNVTDLSARLALDFSLSRVHDRKNKIRFSALRSESVVLGATAEYRRSFGRTVDPDTLVSRAAFKIGVSRLDASFFGGEGARGATRLTLGTELRSDDRLFFFEPLHARALVFGADLTVTRRDVQPLFRDDDLLVSAVVSVRYTNIWTPRPNHTLALNLTAHAALGDLRERSQLISADGLGGLRGYAPGELFTRTRLMARLEYRHWFRHDLDWNIGHYNRVRGIGGAAFVDVAALSPCDSYDLSGRRAWFGAAGYGLRFPYDSFGTVPFLMRVDVAVPLVRRSERSCLGVPTPDPLPVMLYVSFLPPF